MHRIRLREPWTATIDADSGEVLFARKFHRPTGTEQQRLSLNLKLLAVAMSTFEKQKSQVKVLVNGCELSPNQLHSNQSDRALKYDLDNLSVFNSLEIRLPRTTGIDELNGPNFVVDNSPTAIPTFGSFVIESVELLIE